MAVTGEPQGVGVYEPVFVSQPHFWPVLHLDTRRHTVSLHAYTRVLAHRLAYKHTQT